MSWVTYSCSETFKTPLRFAERCGVTRGFPHFRTELAKQWSGREAGKCTYIFMRPTPLAGNYCYRCIYISRAPGIYCRCLISLVYEFYWRELVTRLHRSTETGARRGGYWNYGSLSLDKNRLSKYSFDAQLLPHFAGHVAGLVSYAIPFWAESAVLNCEI